MRVGWAGVLLERSIGDFPPIRRLLPGGDGVLIAGESPIKRGVSRL